ncbi:biotin--[acetyl-CoA-carboxylase] ligase [Erythrobacter sp. QSSC1-22B]|uniref:biotin--[acetyl-CoA-carboxylase] ligase n=1 Tax=Erythrobacter sp. QSSC1-22B TaxID=1860125 RepID=UPI0008052C8D|nr:biotin--[acetyl-CoA-carboxylase] ligase [Erythrobacter sp. QSSC1-22B]OBX20319.1 biotin--[acetyl-CoA-carboxylase] ligase [Erythrobacter sp. QSSC1-22B]
MIRTVPQTGSTNADLLAELRGGERVGEGDWLVADRQSAGRGRQGRDWFDGAGNFMGSTVVRLSPRDPSPATLALVSGVAVHETVSPLLADASALTLKWPNDLLYAGAKLAGILLERQDDAIVVGIGANLAAAPSLPDRATIALADLGPAPDRDFFARGLASHFTAELDRWRTYELEPLIRRWEAAAHKPGTSLTVNSPGEPTINGAFAGLSPEGSLRLRLANGSERVIHAGDVMLAS